jgi:glucose-6-phosphate dehydrogenase assembly protein OpcA
MPYVVYPLTYGNPFYLGQASGVVEIITVTLAVLSIYLWWKNTKAPNTPIK